MSLLDEKKDRKVYEPVERTIQLSASVTMTLVEIPGTDHLAGKYLVTQDQWAAVSRMPQVNRPMAERPSAFEPEGMYQDLPVESVSYEDAEEFINRLNVRLKELGETTYKFKLPTSSEWEYACKGGTTTEYYYGDQPDPDLMNCSESGHNRTTPVDHYPPNPYGLHDTHGNLFEWCQDVD